MKLKNKGLVISIIIAVILLMVLLVVSVPRDKSNNYSAIKNSLSNVFYYLDNSYSNMNDISDYCKVALIYDTNYIDYDYFNYDSFNNKISGYTKNNVVSSLKKILGNDITIDLDNLSKDKCMYNNSVINLTYNTRDKALYTYGAEKSNRTIVVNWNKEEENNSTLELNAQALMIVKNDKYDLYIDSNMEYLIGSYNSLEEAKKSAKDNMNRSYKYIFELEKNKKNYIWKSFKINKPDNEIIE